MPSKSRTPDSSNLSNNGKDTLDTSALLRADLHKSEQQSRNRRKKAQNIEPVVVAPPRRCAPNAKYQFFQVAVSYNAT
jgi:hypothetical protein